MEELLLNTTPDLAQVFKKVMNKIVLLGAFNSDDEAERYKTAYLNDTMELLIVSPIGESRPLTQVVPYNEELLQYS